MISLASSPFRIRTDIGLLLADNENPEESLFRGDWVKVMIKNSSTIFFINKEEFKVDFEDTHMDQMEFVLAY